MYISHGYAKERSGFVVEAKIMLATHLVALDSFVIELSFSPKRQQIKEVKFHPQLAEAGFTFRSEIDEKRRKIILSCSGEMGFVTGSEPIALATLTFFATSPKSELRFGNKTNIRIHEGTATEVVVINQPLAKKLVTVR